MIPASQLAGELAALPATPVSTTFARNVPVNDLFGIRGRLPAPGTLIEVRVPDYFFISGREYRYNQAGTAALYFGEGESTAAAEAKQHPGLKGFNYTPRQPTTVFHVSVILAQVLNLNDLSVQTALAVTPNELVTPWRLSSPNAFTQLLGEAVAASKRFEGILYPSAAMARAGEAGTCLVAYRESLMVGSSITVVDDSGRTVQSVLGQRR